MEECLIDPLKELLRLEYIDDDDMLKCIALGFLLGKLFAGSRAQSSSLLSGAFIRRKVMEKVGKKIPGFEEVFTEEQANSLLSWCQDKGRIIFAEW